MQKPLKCQFCLAALGEHIVRPQGICGDCAEDLLDRLERLEQQVSDFAARLERLERLTGHYEAEYPEEE